MSETSVVLAPTKLIVLGLAFALAGSLTAQAPPTFEVASIKPNKSGLPNAATQILPGGRYTATNASLLMLIRMAYARSAATRELEPFELTGGPAWIAKDRFDLNAKASSEVSLTELRAMLRALLAERFKLETHNETRQAPVYRLVQLRQRQPNQKLRATQGNCAQSTYDPFRGITPGETQPCGYFGPSPTTELSTGRAFQAIRGLTMQQFALWLQVYLGRPVIDSTSLTGSYDGDFEFTAEIVMPPPPQGPGRVNPYDGRVLPSIFSVLPDQLGLKLESTRAPIELLVIDHAELPTPD